jgi:hypothetical protein
MSEDGSKMNDLCDGDPLARALAGLKPAAAGLDVPALMYRAGQKSRDRDVAAWRRACLTVGAGLFATWCGGYLAYNQITTRAGGVAESAPPQPAPDPDTPQTDPNLVMIGRALVAGPRYTPALPPAPVVPISVPLTAATQPSPVAEYIRVRDAVLEAGLAGLPPTAPRPAPTSTGEFERSLPLPAGVYAAPYRAPRPASKPAEPDGPDGEQPVE